LELLGHKTIKMSTKFIYTEWFSSTVNTKKCEFIGCTDLATKPNAKYCKKHAEESKRASWKNSKKKARFKNMPESAKFKYSPIRGFTPPELINTESLNILKKIEKNTSLILKKLEEKEKK
jgi:hypothetical protein